MRSLWVGLELIAAGLCTDRHRSIASGAFVGLLPSPTSHMVPMNQVGVSIGLTGTGVSFMIRTASASDGSSELAPFRWLSELLLEILSPVRFLKPMASNRWEVTVVPWFSCLAASASYPGA